MVRLFFILVSFFSVVAGVFNSAHSQSKPVYTIATISLPPFSYQEKNGDVKGVMIDIIKGISRYGNFSVEIIMVPWKRGLLHTKSGNYDVMALCAHLKNREADFLFTDTLGTGTRALFALKNKSVFRDIANLEDLARSNLRIAVVNGSALETTLEKHGISNYDKITDNNTVIEMLKRDRIDIYYGYVEAISPQLYETGMHLNDLFDLVTIDAVDYGGCIGRSNILAEKILIDFNTSYRKYRKSEEYTALMGKYGVPKILSEEIY